MVYGLLGLLVLFIFGSALWSPGALVLLDYIPTPHAVVSFFDPLLYPLIAILTNFLGVNIVSKLFFLMILVSGASLGVLIGRSISEIFSPRYRNLLAFFGGVFFLMNPFLYERMMVQPTIALGVLLLGYTVYFLFFRKRLIISGLFAGFSLMLMPHAFYMIALIYGLYMVFFFRSIRSIPLFIGTGVMVLIPNLNWILAPFLGHTNALASISTFSPANLEAFRTHALAPLDVWSTNILLYGFWGERYGSHYANVEILSKLWYIAGAGFFLMVVYGIWHLYKKSRKYAYLTVILAVISLIFAIGIASPLTSGLALWMAQYIPMWQGYREPQKWIGLLMIAQGIGFLVALATVFEKYGKDRFIRYSMGASLVMIFLIWTPGALMGYHGQLKTTVYPQEFESFRQEQIAHGFSGKILVLPWHSYIGCSWIGRPTIANPIKGLLSPLSVISADNIEVADILYTNSSESQSQDIETFLKNTDTNLLKKNGFTHIFLMKSCASSSDMETLLMNCIKRGDMDILKSLETYGFYALR